MRMIDADELWRKVITDYDDIIMSLDDLSECIDATPSAQPEPLTDAEQ